MYMCMYMHVCLIYLHCKTVDVMIIDVQYLVLY